MHGRRPMRRWAVGLPMGKTWMSLSLRQRPTIVGVGLRVGTMMPWSRQFVRFDLLNFLNNFATHELQMVPMSNLVRN
jgi:hypothetical protein